MFRLALIIGLLLVALTVAACETTAGNPTPPSGADFLASAATMEAAAVQMKAQATVQAAATADALNATRQAQDAQVRATMDVLAAQGTAQALAATATAQAWAFQSTATAASVQATWTAEARQATATAEGQNATATAVWDAATATAQAHVANLQATVVAATAQAVERQNQREQSTQALKTYGPWALLALAVVLAIIIGYHTLPVLLARWRVIRRKANEGEPLVMLEQGADGSQRIALPLRSFWHLFDTGAAPEAPAPELQDRTAGRQQLANVMLALSGGRNRKKRRAARRLSTPRPPPQLPANAIQVVEPDQVQPWIEDVETQLLEEANQ
jgi:hypothetical protein